MRQQEITQHQAVRLWLVTVVSAMVVFSVAPQIDLAVSSFFYSDAGFIGARSDFLEALRQGIWRVAAAVGLLALAGAMIALPRKTFLGASSRVWNVIVAVYILGPGVAANLLLKAYWGRARPADITQFGGTADFTPALLPADQCARNCSFVSGEASGAAALAVAVWLLSEPVPVPWLRRTLRAAAVAVAVTGSALRVVSGRHFLSDVVFAVLIVSGLALALLRSRERATIAAEVPAE